MGEEAVSSNDLIWFMAGSTLTAISFAVISLIDRHRTGRRL